MFTFGVGTTPFGLAMPAGRSEGENGTDGLELSCCSFLKFSRFLERILMEHINWKNSLDSKLLIYSICSIKTRSRN